MADLNPNILAYRGVRRSYYVYHPGHHGPREKEGQWEATVERFNKTFNDFCAVCVMYTDHESLHEAVGGPAWKKDVLKLVKECEKDDKNVYALESLAETIFDVESRTSQRMLPYFSEIQKRGVEIRAEDFGLSLNGQIASPAEIVRRSWGS